MNNQRVFKMSFASVYPLYVQKAEKKGRKKEEVDQVIWRDGWLCNPFRVGIVVGSLTQGSFCVATLGCVPMPLWGISTGVSSAGAVRAAAW